MDIVMTMCILQVLAVALHVKNGASETAMDSFPTDNTDKLC